MQSIIKTSKKVLSTSFEQVPRGHLIAAPVSAGRRGNPVLWSRRFFPELMTLDGDVGARNLIMKHAEVVADVAVEGRGGVIQGDHDHAGAGAGFEGQDDLAVGGLGEGRGGGEQQGGGGCGDADHGGSPLCEQPDDRAVSMDGP